jgi:hypothetical protein
MKETSKRIATLKEEIRIYSKMAQEMKDFSLPHPRLKALISIKKRELAELTNI